jgi:regulatory protein
MTRRRSLNRLKSKNTDSSPAQQAYLYALRLLTARDYTEARLREKFRSRNYGDADIEAALCRLTSEGWVDDRRFAERFAESALASARYFGQRLRQEMRRRGIPQEIVSEVLGRVLEDHDQTGDIRLILARRFGAFSFSIASDREKRRVVGFMQRRGFSLSAIFSAMRAEQYE